MNQVSRRTFLAWTAAGAAASQGRLHALAPLTAQDIVDRMRKALGNGAETDPVEIFKAGEPSTPVTGIATTSLATMEVLQAAVKAGANMIISCGPTFFSKADTRTAPMQRLPGASAPVTAVPAPPDPVFTAKAAFLRDHGLVVYRLNDHWRTRKPNPFSVGLADRLGWSQYTSPGDTSQVTLPETSLKALVMHASRSLKSRGGMRVIGDPHLRVRKVALLPGSSSLKAALEMLPQVDTLIVGEVREWEAVEYVRDTVDLGGRKSLIYVGRTASEDPGMMVCAQWLKTLVPEVRTTWCTAGDPYWRPTA